MVSASCPNCTIYLVEANSGSISDLEAAETEAVALGAHIISNSYACVSGPNCAFNKADYDTPGVAYVAAAGDYGYTSRVMATCRVRQRGLRRWHLALRRSKGHAWLSRDCLARHRQRLFKRKEAVVATRFGLYASHGQRRRSDLRSRYGTRHLRYGRLQRLACRRRNEHRVAVYRRRLRTRRQCHLRKTVARRFGNGITRKPDDLFRIKRGYNGSCSPKYLCTDGTGEYRDYGGPTGWGTPNGVGAF